MIDILPLLSRYPEVELEPGETLLHQGEQSGKIFFLIEGMVAVSRSGTQIAAISEPGAVFGEMSILLETAHTADVKTLVKSKFYRVDDGAKLMREDANISGYVAMILARRVNGLSKYLVDLKQQYGEREDHMGMIDDMLDTLINRHPRAIQRRPALEP